MELNFKGYYEEDTCDGYPSVRLRDTTCWNIKMIIYSLIFNITVIGILFYWKIATPMLLIILRPIVLNILFLLASEEKRRTILQREGKNWLLISFYSIMALITLATAVLSVFFLIAITSFNYKYELYYPSIGWGFLNLLLMFASLVTSIYSLSFIKLVYDQRKFFN